VKDLITLTGTSPGLMLEDVKLQGFTHSAVKVINCAGEKGNPVRLTGLTVTAPGKDTWALFFDAGENIIGPLQNDHIIISDSCRFDGFGERDPVEKKGNSVGPNVVFPRR